LHGWKRALARIVERSHLDRRKPLAPLSSFRPVSLDSETRIGTAATPGVDRSCHVHPPRYLDKAPGTTIALIILPDRLPAGTKLEPVGVTADGHDLAGVRGRIKAANAELEALRRTPAPSDDIEARVEGLRARARAEGAGRRRRRAPQHRVARCPFVVPDRMLALVMTEVERMANDPLPVAQRPPRVAALERDLDELHRVEAALVAAALAAGSSVHRSPSAPPAAVLGVRVTDRASRAA
jgi:hypothetical protein